MRTGGRFALAVCIAHGSLQTGCASLTAADITGLDRYTGCCDLDIWAYNADDTVVLWIHHSAETASVGMGATYELEGSIEMERYGCEVMTGKDIVANTEFGTFPGEDTRRHYDCSSDYYARLTPRNEWKEGTYWRGEDGCAGAIAEMTLYDLKIEVGWHVVEIEELALEPVCVGGVLENM